MNSNIFAIPVALIIMVFAMVFWMIAATVAYERENPCLEYGEERLSHFQQIGSAMIPIYDSPCLRRGRRQ